MKDLVKKQKGFTIIEVLIVLAIAGLIILIVFLAVPALQRNSRNTQRKNDVSAVLAAISEHQNNNNGTLPDGGQLQANVKTSFFTGEDIDVSLANGTAGTGTADDATLQVINFTKCNEAGDAAASEGATKRNVVALYSIETSGGSQPKCQDI